MPGESPLHRLHRITESAGATSKQRCDQNEAVRKLDCNENTPGAPAAGKDCDEYPFRSSAEGAARYQYEGDEFKDDLSVRYINREENQEAGRRLGAWYHSDRILDWEAFTRWRPST
ncbi:NucA/NucB deoxyribonuclease domain-containing protein [Streptomyces sp. NPDC048430]|uniref:NucA/NucB deoxyribonuclease domain-containing protein n=1 Tax=Streptomyces sp. NPDC048430 TaxID=3155388 RepID=UPI00342D65C8